MKNKLISIALLLGMILSLLSIAPAGVSAASPVADDFPYMLYDFEDGKNITNKEGVTEFTPSGADGRGHALKITTTAGGGGELGLIKKSGSSYSGTVISAGETMRLSFWFKPTVASSGSFLLICYTMGGVISGGAIGDTTTTNWQKITLDYTATEDTTLGNLYFRTPISDSFLIDDFEAKIITIREEERSDQIANLDGYYASYEGNVAPLGIYQAGYWNTTKTERNNGAVKGQIVANPDGDGQAVKITLADNAGHGHELFVSNNINTGTYSAGYVPTGTIPAGSKVTMRFKYYLETPLSADTAFGFSCQLYNGSGYYLTGTNFDSTPKQWNTATLTYTNNTGSEITMPTAVKTMPMRAAVNFGGGPAWKAAVLGEGETTYGTRVVYFDDMELFVTAEGEELPEQSSETDATSAELAAEGEFVSGSKVTFLHTFTPSSESTEAATDESVVKLMNTLDGLTYTVCCAKIGEEMTVPELPSEGVLSFEVIPIDSDGSVGMATSYTYAGVAGFYAGLELSEFAEDGSITAMVNMENRKRDGSSVNAILMVYMYDSFGGVVKYETKSMICANDSEITEDSEAGKLTVSSDTEDPALSEVAYVEAYLWDCGTEEIPTIQNVKMKELAPDCKVIK